MKKLDWKNISFWMLIVSVASLCFLTINWYMPKFTWIWMAITIVTCWLSAWFPEYVQTKKMSPQDAAKYWSKFAKEDIKIRRYTILAMLGLYVVIFAVVNIL